ncbi:hypothetical protein FUA48_10560 [Flavobacterium alkalisoli]|uniref:Uncharacterized protein n=1 Tax=Flavobacterium alkalisoli TaxID=2602769 RepID=A0A5B9FSU3_9FLAO|nr:hypothetical protein [Flavobacterium alkalisoli]QEE50005.1 hypothetical protein FUA48_10560 [Flavobacterium alkalisoli]
MQLPRGITGFNIQTSNTFFTKENVKEFLSGLTYPFIIKDIEQPHHTANYFRITIINTQGNSPYIMLVHECFPFASIIQTDSPKQITSANFIAIPNDFKESITALTFLEPEILQQEVNQQHIANLGKTEINQIEYWQPQSLGEIIFNHYD